MSETNIQNVNINKHQLIIIDYQLAPINHLYLKKDFDIIGKFIF